MVGPVDVKKPIDIRALGFLCKNRFDRYFFYMLPLVGFGKIDQVSRKFRDIRIVTQLHYFSGKPAQIDKFGIPVVYLPGVIGRLHDRQECQAYKNSDKPSLVKFDNIGNKKRQFNPPEDQQEPIYEQTVPS